MNEPRRRSLGSSGDDLPPAAFQGLKPGEHRPGFRLDVTYGRSHMSSDYRTPDPRTISAILYDSDSSFEHGLPGSTAKCVTAEAAST